MTEPKPSLSVVVPAFNEAAGIPDLAREMGAFLDAHAAVRPVQLVLVDDGSTDETAARMREFFGDRDDTTVVAHPHNLGLGAALETGGAAATGAYVAWFDSDLTYRPEILSALAARLDEGADVALTSCYHPDGGIEGVPAWRLALSKAASSLYQRLTRGDLHTYTSMVRGYRREVLAACAPQRGGFLAVTEVLLRALRGGYRCVEVPAVLARRRTGQSKMRILRVAFGHANLAAAWLLGLLKQPVPVDPAFARE